MPRRTRPHEHIGHHPPCADASAGIQYICTASQLLAGLVLAYNKAYTTFNNPGSFVVVTP